uniref:HDC13490 n=1 Tax=Drosophila melanogaster TaxID=7227 RepID=Q6IK25_DROME|nr:TPA_inf: HDC13490 [Drosophila melanogaster]
MGECEWEGCNQNQFHFLMRRSLYGSNFCPTVPVLAEGFLWLLVAYWFSVPCRRKDNVNG